jgi:hypothetical protein
MESAPVPLDNPKFIPNRINSRMIYTPSLYVPDSQEQHTYALLYRRIFLR